MSAKKIEELLTVALLEGGAMQHELYEYELEDQLDDLRESLAEDDDDYLFVITENNNDVAMLLLEKSGTLFINEAAREKLKEYWQDAYVTNIQDMIPTISQELADNELVVNGVKTANRLGNDKL